MGDPKKAAEPRRVKRLTLTSPGVVTINTRSAQILVFWASPNLLFPVVSGWYLHAASMGKDEHPGSGGEASSAQFSGFDPADPKVKWKHAKITRLGWANLSLEVGRSYMFYVTADLASPQDLLRHHLPWPFIFRPPKSAGRPAVIAFRAWSLDIDHRNEDSDHRKHEKTRQGSHRDPVLVGFDSWEHEAIAGQSDRKGQNVQRMVNWWARHGLIDGGALIDTQGPFSAWQIWCPGESSSATSTSPYGTDPISSSAHWHYVIPDKDPNKKTWTRDTLQKAIQKGHAVALTIGQVIMLAGDLFNSPNDMETNDSSGKHPTNVMKVYWEARTWLDGRKDALKNGNFDLFSGYQQRYGIIYLLFDLLMGDPDEIEKSETVDKMKSLVDDWDLKIAETVADVDKEPLKRVFDRHFARTDKVNALVDLLKAASGDSRFQEIHFLAQTLSYAAKGKGFTLEWMKSRLPWLAEKDLQKFRAVAWDKDEIDWFEKSGTSDQLAQFIVTNGRYADLALHNESHFSDGGLNFNLFKTFHQLALGFVGGWNFTFDHPIPARSLFQTAFGCHFLTDAFSASHMRVPRRKLGAFTAKLMHDADGLVGLWVYSGGPPEPRLWYAFGDTHLFANSLKDKQKQLLYLGMDPSLNFEYAAAAVGSALKQLYYQAHARWQTEPTHPASSPLPKAWQAILDSAGPRDEMGKKVDLATATRLDGEWDGPGAAGPEAKTLWERLRMTIDDRIAYLKSLVPTPLPPAPERPARIPVWMTQNVNIPPLFTTDENVDPGAMKTYDIVRSKPTGWTHVIQPFTPYKGFQLRVNWGPFRDFRDDEAELRLGFEQYYFLTKFFKDVPGLGEFLDVNHKTLLDVLDQLPTERW